MQSRSPLVSTIQQLQVSERAKGFLILFYCLLGFHLLGVILLIINACYLKCTKGITSARLEANQCSLGLKRPCKVRNTAVCNILIIFQLVLAVIESGIWILKLIRYHEILEDILFLFWILLTTSNVFIIITVCLPVAHLTGAFKSSAHIGPIHAWNVFEFYNFVLLCFLLSLLVTALEQGWPLHIIITFVIGSLIGTYAAIITGAAISYSRFKVYSKLITKEEVLTIINNSLSEPPYIQWSIRCTRQGSSES